MPNCDQYFTTIEAYDDMTIEQLQVRPPALPPHPPPPFGARRTTGEDLT